MRQGDIILVPFPFTNLASFKTRPALIISKPQVEDIIVAAITKKESHVAIKIEDSDLQTGKLPLTSFVRYDKVVTLHQDLVLKNIAHIKPEVLDDILKAFSQLF